ncbi:MAG: type I methionyl aminopeptidase [Mycoplasmatales bacterium]
MEKPIIKTNQQIEKIKYANKIVGYCHFKLRNFLKAGVTTIEINQFVNDIITKHGGTSAFLGYQDFPDVTCIAINDIVLHGVDQNQPLKDGDIISVDIGVDYQGYFGDSAWTYAIGNVSSEAKRLMEATEKSLYAGLETIKNKTSVRELSKAIEAVAKKEKLGIVRDFVGHGVGVYLHEEPYIPNYEDKTQRDILKTNMIIAVEPIFTLGSGKVYIDADDGWTVYSEDKSLACHYEHTVLVTENGYEILTLQEDFFKN